MATFKELNRQWKFAKHERHKEMSVQNEEVFFILGRADEANVVKSAAET